MIKNFYIFLNIIFFIDVYLWFSTDGKPRGFLVDTLCNLCNYIFSFIFLYFIYTIYRAGIKKKDNLSWYISMTALFFNFFHLDKEFI